MLYLSFTFDMLNLTVCSLKLWYQMLHLGTLDSDSQELCSFWRSGEDLIELNSSTKRKCNYFLWLMFCVNMQFLTKWICNIISVKSERSASNCENLRHNGVIKVISFRSRRIILATEWVVLFNVVALWILSSQ